MKLVVSPEAAADIERLRAFLAENNSDAAAKAAGILIEAVQSLAELPERGRPSGIPGVRELIVAFGGSAYVVRYAHRISAKEVVILRIWHGREMR